MTTGRKTLQVDDDIHRCLKEIAERERKRTGRFVSITAVANCLLRLTVTDTFLDGDVMLLETGTRPLTEREVLARYVAKP